MKFGVIMIVTLIKMILKFGYDQMNIFFINTVLNTLGININLTCIHRHSHCVLRDPGLLSIRQLRHGTSTSMLEHRPITQNVNYNH